MVILQLTYFAEKVDRLKYFLLVLLLSFVFCASRSQSPGYGSFVENIGQYPEEVKYYASLTGGTLFIAEDGLTYAFLKENVSKGHSHHTRSEAHNLTKEGHALKINFLESNEFIKVSGAEQTKASYNYFYGSDSSKWIRGARSYRSLKLEEVYDGIDVELSSSNGRIKYDLILDPGIDPAVIKMEYLGASNMQLIDQKLHLDTPFGSLSESIPASFAVHDGEKRKIDASYTLSNNVVSFESEPVGEEEQIVIDPLLVFSTYSGSPSDNWGNTATFDEFGNAYSGGITSPERGTVYLGEFPATPGVFQFQPGGDWDIALLKFDSAGTELLYATYLGGSGAEVPQSLIVDDNGDLLILGVTSSPEFPVTSNAFDTSFNGGTSFDLLSGINMERGSDLFVAKLSADGSRLISSTFLGGQLNDGMLDPLNALARNYGDESRGDINFDSEGNILIASRTASQDFPMINSLDSTFNGLTDAVVMSLKSDLSAVNWSTFMGGSQTDIALSLKVDANDNLFIAGGTTSPDFPVTDSSYQVTFGGDADGWIAHLLKSGDSLVAATYLGTNAYDQTFFLDLDVDENVFVAGQTMANYPITLGKFSNGSTGQFIQKLSNDLRESKFSTVIGQEGRIIPNISLTAFLVNECDNIYLSGWGSPTIIQDNNNFLLQTSGLPITSDAYQPVSDGSSFYLAVLSGDASELLYSTHLGSANSMVHVDGGTSRFDKNGIVYHSVCASCPQDDSSFPTTEGAYAETNLSAGCSNAVFKFDLASLRARFQTNDFTFSKPGLDQGCIPLDVVFENNSTGGEVYEWTFGDGGTYTAYDKEPIIHRYERAGTYQVVLRAFDPNTCIAEDYAYGTIVASTTEFKVIDDQTICFGDELQLTASGGTSYRWFPDDLVSNSYLQNPTVSPPDTTMYIVDIKHVNGCSLIDTVVVNVVQRANLQISVEQSDICEGGRTLSISNNSETFTSILWDFGDGNISEEFLPEYRYQENGDYVLRASLTNHICTDVLEQRIPVQEMFVPNVITRNRDGLNDTFDITSEFPVDLHIFNRWGQLVHQSLDYQNDWDGGDLSAGTYYYDIVLPTGEQCNGWMQIIDGK